MKTILETERLVIREINPTDVDVMLELHSDPEVHLYLGGNTITSRVKMLEAIDSLEQQYQNYGVGRWAMIKKSTNEFIGWTGLEFVTKEINNHRDYYDLGYRLKKKFWRKGFATESAIASLDYGFNQLKANRIFAMADVQNKGSNKILNNLGLQFIEHFEYEGVQHNWYKLEKSAYQDQK